MYKILRKQCLNPTVTRMDVEAPLIAKKAEPGQFIILRVDADGERIPLTIADYDREAGWVSIIFQIVGATTENSITSKKAISFTISSALSENRPKRTDLKKSRSSAAAWAALSHIPWLKKCTKKA